MITPCSKLNKQKSPRRPPDISIRTRSRVFASVLTVFAGQTSSVNAEQMTLESALATAYVSNPQLEAQRAALRATDEEVNKALGGWRPTLGANGSYGWQQQRQTLLGPQNMNSIPQSEQVTLSQSLFDGRTIPGIEHAKELVSAGREQLLATEQTILLNAASAYFSVLRDTQIVEAYRDDIRQLRSIQENTRARLRIGDLTKTDVSQASARLLESQINLATAEQQLAASRASFEHVIGRPAEALVEHPAPSIPATREAVLATAIERNPSLLQRREEARAADENVDIARGALLPSMSVQAQYGRSIDIIAPGVSENGISVVGQLNIPLYQGGTEEAAIREAKEQSSQALLTSYDAERQVTEDTANAWEAFQAAIAASDFSIKQASANEIAYTGTTMESRVGSRSIIDILNAEQELLQSKVTAITQRQASIVAAYRVLSVMGRMTAIDLRLPVTPYDPAKHFDEDATRWFGFGN